MKKMIVCLVLAIALVSSMFANEKLTEDKLTEDRLMKTTLIVDCPEKCDNFVKAIQDVNLDELEWKETEFEDLEHFIYEVNVKNSNRSYWIDFENSLYYQCIWTKTKLIIKIISIREVMEEEK